MTESGKHFLHEQYRQACKAEAVIGQELQHPFVGNWNKLYFQPYTVSCILQDNVNAIIFAASRCSQAFFQFHSQVVCEYKNVTAHLKSVVINGKALTYHAVQKKQEYTQRNGLSKQQNVRHNIYKRKQAWHLERNNRKNEGLKYP